MSRPRRILALATNPASAASTRFRVLQWRRDLEAAGFSLALDSFFSEPAAAVMYAPGRSRAKLAHVAAGLARRWRTLRQAGGRADLLLIHREAFPLGIVDATRALRRFGGPVVYDYDDAMFLSQRAGRGILARLENLGAPARIMGRSDLVLAGNRFLADYAARHARRVVTLPTCVDTERFRPAAHLRGDPPVIGWIGSHSTAKYLDVVRDVLAALARTHRFAVYVVGSAAPIILEGVTVEQAPWALAREVEDFARCDIGIYPLADDAWVKGKCGFKAIQFMACGVPVVASAVGVNREIVEDGVNGFLAATAREWTEKLALLLEDVRLRDKLGEAGRRTVEERYSVAGHAPTVVGAFRTAARSIGAVHGWV